MIEIYVIRHGETKLNKEKVIIGHTNIGIIDSSIIGINKLIEKIKNIKFDSIYSSSLKRTVQTAKVINKNLKFKTKIIISEDIKEIDYGKLSGMDKEKAKKEYPKYHKDINFINPEGESFKDLNKRIIKFLDKLSKSRYKRILIITHAGCIRSIYSYLKNEKLQDNINMKISHNFILKGIIKNNNKEFSII